MTNKKAETRGNGFGPKNTDHFAGNHLTFSNENYTGIITRFQCKRCRSDYMKYAVDDYCQDCQQRVEYMIRERPETTVRACASARGHSDDNQRRRYTAPEGEEKG